MIHDAERMMAAKEEIARLEELESDNFHIIRAINLEYSLNCVNQEQPKTYTVCPSTHLRTTVTPFGVYVCPYWRGKKNLCVGDVQVMSFKEVWHGERRTEVMARCDASKICSFHCLRHETNLICYKIKEELHGQGKVKTVAEFDRFI
jgi:hypothetical protein